MLPEIFFNIFPAQLKLPQVVGFRGGREGLKVKFINNVVKSGKMWFKFQYI